MSDHSFDPSHGPSRQYVPDVTPLEGRCLLSEIVRFPDGNSFIIPTIRLPRTSPVAIQSGAALEIVRFPDGNTFTIPTIRLPRTGGVAVQSGAALEIAVAARPATSTLQITDDGAGNVTAEWDGGPVHTFHGVRAIVAQVEGRRSETVDISLTGPLTKPMDIAVTLHGTTNAITANLGGHGPNLPVLLYHVVIPGSKHTEVTID